MINLRYHIVSLTAVFLAIGIGLTLGSTFLDRATVDNLQGQLENLETRLDERNERISELEGRLGGEEQIRDSLDEQAVGLLAGQLEDVPVAVFASRGVDEPDVRGALRALVAAGADVQGIFWFTNRWDVDETAEVDDLSSALDETSDDPSRLRRMAISVLAEELRDRQATLVTGDEEPGDGPAAPTTDDPAAPATDDPTLEPTEPTTTDPQPDIGPTAPSTPVLRGLIENGFVDYEAVPEGPELPLLAEGTRLLLVGGSTDVPDDLVLEPLVDRMARAAVSPLLAVAGSARAEDGQISDLVSVIRESEQLREIVPTVDDLEHFDSWAAMVLAMADAAEGVVGHYGVADGASRLLPPLPAP